MQISFLLNAILPVLTTLFTMLAMVPSVEAPRRFWDGTTIQSPPKVVPVLTLPCGLSKATQQPLATVLEVLAPSRLTTETIVLMVIACAIALFGVAIALMGEIQWAGRHREPWKLSLSVVFTSSPLCPLFGISMRVGWEYVEEDTARCEDMGLTLCEAPDAVPVDVAANIMDTIGVVVDEEPVSSALNLSSFLPLFFCHRRLSLRIWMSSRPPSSKALLSKNLNCPYSSMNSPRNN